MWGVAESRGCLGFKSCLPILLRSGRSVSLSVLICQRSHKWPLHHSAGSKVNAMRKGRHPERCCSHPLPPPCLLTQGVLWAGSLEKRKGHLPGGSRPEMEPLTIGNGPGKGHTIGNYCNIRKCGIKPPSLPLPRGRRETPLLPDQRRKFGNVHTN